MKALAKVKLGYGNLELLEIGEPQVKDDLVKIKVKYSGVCGSDIHSYKGEYKVNVPVILGHEFSGIVTEVGRDVTKVKVGDRVTSETTFKTCEECDFCKSKDYNLCPTRKGIGTQVDGSFAEYVLSREESVHILPDNVSALAASLTEPLACCVHAALEKTSVSKGDIVLVIGPGPMGLLLSQVAKSQGAYVILSGVSKDRKRLDLALELGVDLIVDSMTENLDKIVMDRTNGYGADKVFDCSGMALAVNQGLNLIRKQGDFVQVGIFAEKYDKIDLESIVQREIRYIGSRSQKPSSWTTSLKLLEEEKVNLEALVTKIVKLEDWEEGLNAVLKGTEVKAVIKS